MMLMKFPTNKNKKKLPFSYVYILVVLNFEGYTCN